MPVVRDLLVFQLGQQRCGLPVEKVQEIVPMAALVCPPGLPSLLEGFLNLRGTAVPVVRLDRLFRLPPWSPGLYTPLVVVRGGAHPMALLAGRVDSVVRAPESAWLPVEAEHCFNDCTEAEVLLEPDGEPIHLLSCERLLLEQERRRIAELQATAQQYCQDLEAAV